MTIDLDSLIAPLTSDQLYERLLDQIEALGVPARSWKGKTAKAILGALAELGYQGHTITRDAKRGMFILLARGKYLTAHAKDVYDVDRIVATFAAGEVTLTNTGVGAVYDVGANELIVRASSSGARFVVTEAFVLPGGASVTVDVRAVEAGSGSTVGPNEIDELETTLSKVAVSNAASIVGTDEESDDALVSRALTKKGTWSPFGPVDAYEHAALSATLSDGSPTGITRVAVSRFSSIGKVTVVCATASGTPTAAELAAATENVRAKAKTGTATLVLSGAVPKPTAHTITLWARGGVAATIEANAQAALGTLIGGYPIGGIPKTSGGQGYLYLDAIAAAVIASSPEAFDADFSVGATDIALAWNEVATNTTTFDVRIV